VAAYKRVPFVFELRDLWPESIKAVGAMKDSIWIRLLEKLELALYRRATLIVSVTSSFKKILIDRGVDDAKIQIVTNGVDLTRFKPQAKDGDLLKQLGLEDKFVVGYIGTHGMAHSLETLLESARLMSQHPDSDRYRFLFLGDGARRSSLIERARLMNLKNCIFVESVPKSEVANYWSVLDASIIHLKKTDLFKTVIPSKLFESMGMGIPILHGVSGESAGIVEEHDVGLIFEPGNPSQLCDRIIAIATDSTQYARLKENCLGAASHYERRHLAGEMLKYLQGIV
jgi:glycosyltransferase involved in cell wall biosynthesis